jgi:predicted amidohydrolase
MYITCPVLDSCGEVILRQIKTHPFRSEQKFFSKDSEFKLFDIKGCKVGVMICYDLCFPEVARVLSLQGADILFNPSRIRTDGIDPWHLYGEMRSLENRILVVSINVANPPQHSGGTIIHGIKQRENIVYPIAIAEAGSEPGIVLSKVDFKYPRALRRARLKDRNVKAYSLLLSPDIPE